MLLRPDRQDIVIITHLTGLVLIGTGLVMDPGDPGRDVG